MKPRSAFLLPKPLPPLLVGFGVAGAPVTNAALVTNNPASVTLTDTNATGPVQFYRVLDTSP
jgi:hypothetical protein